MPNVVHPNPATVEALLDTTWRIAAAETSRTDVLDRKAATLATFASLLVTLAAALGDRFLRAGGTWAAAAFSAGLLALVLSVGLGVRVLLPREYLTLGSAYIERFPTWAEIRKTPEQVRGETMQGLVAGIAHEREANDGKAEQLRIAFLLLFVGLVVLAAETATLGLRHTIR